MRILLLFTLQFFIVFSVSAAIWTVNDPSDLNPTTGGTGSGASGDLRYCVTNAAYGDLISFNLAAPYKITLNADLIINGGLTIDGSTQPGFSSVPLVSIAGTGVGIISNGSSDLYIKYLIFNTTGKAAITTNYVDGVYIDGCYFGTDATGLNYSTATPDTAIYVTSSSYGVYIGNNAGNVILSPTGIVMDNNSSGNYVFYNMIGLNKNGFNPGGVKTNNKGITLIQSTYNDIEYNWIGNCNSSGILVDPNSYSNTLSNNYIGKSMNGISTPNGVGMLISGYSNAIDRDSISYSKKISGSSGAGIEISGAAAVDNKITTMSFNCNEGGGIKFTNGAVPYSAPTFDASSDTIYADGWVNLSGTANAYDNIHFYLQDNCSFGPQGTFIGGTSADASGIWYYNSYLSHNFVPLTGGMKITAIAVSSTTSSGFSNIANLVAFPCSSVKLFAGNNTTACDNTPVLLNGTLTNASHSNSTWSTTGLGYFTPSIYYSTGTPTYYDPTYDIAAGSSSVKITLSTSVVGCPPVTSTFTLSLPIPQAVVFSGNSYEYVCFNKTGIPLDLKLYNSTLGGTWSTTGTGSFSPSATALNASYIPSVSDSVNGVNITFTPNKSATGCSAINNIVNMYFNASNPSILGSGDMKVCSNSAPGLNAEISGASYTESWTYLNGVAIKDSVDYFSTHHYVPSASDLAAGSAAIVLTVTTPGCKPAYDTTVFTFVKAPIVSIGQDSAIMCGNATSLTLNKATVTGNPGGSLSWTGLAFYNGGLLKKNTKPSAAKLPQLNMTGYPIDGTLSPDTALKTVYYPDAYGYDRTAPGGVVLYLTATTADKVCSVTADLPIIFMSVPDSVYAGPDLTLCQGDTIPLSGYVSPGYPVKWSTPGSGTFLDNTSLNTGYVPSSGDNKRIAFNISLIGGDKLCPVKDEFLLILLPKPDVGVGANQTICPETGVTITGALGDDQIGIWTLVSGSGIFSDSSKSTVFVSNINDKENSYLWTVTDTTTHCTNSATYKVNYCFAPPLKVFNALSPNNDGLGEFMEIENIGFYPDNRVCIFNNWGDLVFKTDKYTNSGDNVFVGKSNVGTIQELPSGTYFFLIDKNYKEEKADKGIVVIQR